MKEERPIFEPTVREEVQEELAFHVEMRVRELMAQGMDEAAARADAVRRFGDLAHVQAECRRLGEGRDRVRRRAALFSELRHDVRFALRQLRRSPGFTAVAVLTLAIGVGATTAIFSVVEAVLLESLPYPASDRLVVPESVDLANGNRSSSVTYGDFLDWQQDRVFDKVAVYWQINVNVAGGTAPERIQAVQMTEEFLPALGVMPTLGRFLRREEFVHGAPRRGLISYELWQRRFAGRRDVVGRPLRVTGVDVEIVGVLPQGLGYPQGVDLWLPLRVGPEELTPDYFLRRDNFIFNSVARLAAGRTLEATRARMTALAQRVSRAEPATRSETSMTATPLAAFVVGDNVPRTLWVLLGAVGLVLAIGCVNVANLLLARSAGRQRELGMRAALGAGRGRLLRQLLTESLVLGLAGGTAGIAVAWAGMRGILATAPADTPRLEGTSLDLPVLAFALGVSLLAAVLFGISPALRLTRTSWAAAGAESGTRAITAARGGKRRLMVAIELALSLLLLVGAGLLMRSLGRLTATDPGFETARLLTFSLSLQGDRYDPEGSIATAFADIVERLDAVPGVERASLQTALPLGGGGFYLGRSFLFDGQPEPPASEATSAQWDVVTPGTFETLGIPLLRGRDFTAADRQGATPVMIVSEEMARQMFPRGDALGKRVRSWRDENVYREVVGIVGDVRVFGAGDEIRPVAYIPHRQNAWNIGMATLRTTGEPTAVVPAVRRALAAFDPELPIGNLQTMEDVLHSSVAPRRFAALLLSGFAVIALALALVGIYGVLSYEVAQRTREIGIRMALGSRRAEVLRLVVGEAATLAAIGVGAGAAVALLLARFVRPLLYETAATDPPTYLAATVLLAGMAILAAWVPAWRAARANPMSALRGD